MAKSAATNLTDYIETIRQEAYNEGYAAAMRAVVEFSGSGPTKSKATKVKTTAAKAITVKMATTAKKTTAKAAAATTAPRRQRRAQTKPAVRQNRRGDNARYIVEAMMMLPNHTGPAAAIRKALDR